MPSWLIDHATRSVFFEIKSKWSAAAAQSLINAQHRAAPFRTKVLLTDNRREFLERRFGRREKDASCIDEFDSLCQALGIEHRLTELKYPHTNSMVHRFNGRLTQALKQHRFNRANYLAVTRHRFV